MTSDCTAAFDRRQFLAALSAFMVACGSSVDIDTAGPTVVGAAGSTFHTIYDDPKARAEFKGFFEEVFRLYPPDALHELVTQATRTHASDEQIYGAVVDGLPGISPRARLLRLAIPALSKQKKVMAAQAGELAADMARVDGYLEVGTVGRYANAISKHVTLVGPKWVLNDRAPSKDPADIIERGQLAQIGTFTDLDDYAPVSTDIPDASVGLMTNFIGFHHAPLDKLDGFITSLRRVIRPGGRLLLREHDVVDAHMTAVVSLAHDVFNAGTDVTWTDNQAEIRKFRSVAEWTRKLEGMGFTYTGKSIAQDGDPTNNLLLGFDRV